METLTSPAPSAILNRRPDCGRSEEKRIQGGNMKRSIRWRLPMAIAAVGLLLNVASASAAGTNVRLTHDEAAGRHVSAYTRARGNPHTHPTLDECSRSQRR